MDDADVFESELAECRLHRSSIDQAVGVLIQMLSVDEDHAFEILRLHSVRRGFKLHVLAARLVASAAVGDTPADCDDFAEGVMQHLADCLNQRAG